MKKQKIRFLENSVVTLYCYTSAVRVCKKMQTQTLSITESKHFCFRKPAKIQYKSSFSFAELQILRCSERPRGLGAAQLGQEFLSANCLIIKLQFVHIIAFIPEKRLITLNPIPVEG